MDIFDKFDEFDFSDKEKADFMREVIRDAKQFERWQKECPWEIQQWDSIEFGWKQEMFYLN